MEPKTPDAAQTRPTQTGAEPGWVAAEHVRNPWAIVSSIAALLGVACAGAVAGAAAELGRLADLSDDVAYGLFGAVPALGVIALATGLVGRHRRRLGWLAWLGLLLGALLVVAALTVVIVLVWSIPARV